jgi:shikimate kinase/3-dehydroquinate synthase
MRIFLSGPMGSGKSTAAKALGELAGLPVVDLDARIVAQTGVSVAEIFRSRGEQSFRELEAAAVDDLLRTSPACVVALGGGTVTSQRLRRRLLAAGVLVTLDAPPAELARRVGGGEERPLLADVDVVARLGALREARADAYAECHARIDTSRVSPHAIAAQALRIAHDPPIVVPLGTRTYRVEVGAGVRSRLPERLLQAGGSAAALLVSDSQIGPLWGRELAAQLTAAGVRVVSVELAPGEPAKTLDSVHTLWNTALDAGIDRGWTVLGVGGGVVGDLSGFAGATLLRGVRVGHVPTTLLAMVDSAIGGKTGFDTRHGKNLIGAIHQPSFVLSDVEVLATLPIEERRAGLAEVVKCAWLDGEAAVAELEADAPELVAGDVAATLRAIRMAARLKARIVSEDEREQGARALLNLGHTLGHAIESSQGYEGMRHGEAVSLGMVAAFRVAARLGHADAAQGERARRLLDRLGLPTGVDGYLTERVLSFLGSDKKRARDSLGYVVPALPGQAEQVSLPIAQLTALLCGK